MVKRKKRGQAGSAAQYLTRSQALKKLQLSLPVFRRLCILKGIHPREPKKKPHGLNKTYYHVKDINFLLHEPLLLQFREGAAYEKKIKKARARKNRELLLRLIRRRPNYRLDHLVKERYPSFIDALRDLDDALTLAFLFATLPADKAHKLPQKELEQSRRLVLEWQAFVVRSHSLRKVFVTVRGYYFQAEVMGQTITWITPHQVAQVLTPDVDYRVMLTFLEFYIVLLRFVNYKLYHTIGLKYPPGLNSELEQTANGLEAIMSSIAQHADGDATEGEEQPTGEASRQLAKMGEILEDDMRKASAAGGDAANEEDGREDGSLEDNNDEEDEEEEDEEDDDDEEEEEEGGSVGVDDGEGAMQAIFRPAGAEEEEEDEEDEVAKVTGGAIDAPDEAAVCEKLFKGLCFFLGREVPREPLLLVIRSFGGTVGWAGEGSPFSENHEHITHQVVDRPFQGHRFLDREYVQPQWVFDSANFRVLAPCNDYAPGASLPPHLSPFDTGDDYEPEWQKTMQELQGVANKARQRHLSDGMEFALEDGAAAKSGEGSSATGSNLDADAVSEAAYQVELAKEIQAAEGQDPEEQASEAPEVRPALKEADSITEDDELMKIAMMSKKAKRLYQSIQYGKARKSAHVEKLKAKREALEAKRQKTTKL
mmetsp:Transcript_3131/g.8905  ORF Transcript_3131/g.8905 Transcript_3131/m.8905 type:complete len:652 (+) Transcript_3131:162-2117(+)